MGQRQSLHERLEAICPDRVHFQPPPDVQLTYPAIVYRRSPGQSEFANNRTYMYSQQYDVTLISRDPDSDSLRAALIAIPMSTHDVFFVADNLNHDVYSIYS